MSNTEKNKDEIIAETMKEFYDSIEKKENPQVKEEPVDIQSELEAIQEQTVPEEQEVEIDESEEDTKEAADEAADEEDDDIQYVEDTDEDVEDEEDAKKGKSVKKKVLITLGSIFGVLILVYVGFAVFFGNHFLFNTTINGTDYSLKSVEAVAADMDTQVQEYVLTIEESDGDTETVAGKDISLEYVPTEELSELAAAQDRVLWIKSLWEHPELEATVVVNYNENSLNTIIKKMDCLKEENQVKSVNAHPEFKETQFEVVEEVIGTEIDEEVFVKAVNEAVDGFEPVLTLSETDCYLLPKFVSDSEEVIKACEEMNSYLGAEITYDLHPHEEVVDSAVIADWITVNDKMEVKFSKKKLKAFVTELAEKYNTWGKDRKFKTATGNVVTVSGGKYGWLLDQDAEYKQLKEDVQNGKAVKREPMYHSYGRAAEHTDTDWGSTYAEVDLTNQKMYFVKNGNVVLESLIVTGNPNKGNATPQGMYSLTYKTRNAVLRGRRDENGVPEYESPVAYWMPFNGGIGFHDATWQSSFGGNRYRTNGSHGCVNMPKSKAGELYNLIPDKCPVICHY